MGITYFSKDKNEVKWYVTRAYKHEAKAEEELSKADIEFFIPKHYVIRTFHGVKSKRLTPAIPSIIFVHASFNDIYSFKTRYPFLHFVTWTKSAGSEILVVRDDEMENFIKVASKIDEGITFYNPNEIELTKGTPVLIHGGPFDNVRGKILSTKGKRNRHLVVEIKNYIVASVEVTPEVIEILPEL